MDIDTYDSPEALELLRAGETRMRRGVAGRERITHAAASVGFVTVAVALAALAPWDRGLRLEALVAVIVAYVAAELVRFPVGAGWTAPSQLVFVPMLFVLPTPVVPLVASLGVLLARLPELVRGRSSAGRTLTAFGDSWYALGPALVLVLAGAQTFSWSHWPAYVLALGAQFAFDLGATLARCWFAERISPATHLPLLLWIYAVDTALAPLGLLIAAAAVVHPGLVLLALPLTGLLALFAGERRQRLEQAVTLSDAYRGTALLLGDVVEGDDAYTGSHSRGVLELSLAVCDRLGLRPTQRRNVEFAALLHDVGKIRVPKEIINKPGPLNPDEWKIMHRHTIEGEAMLNRIGGVLAEAGTVVRSSHERYDGRGYPDGLAGTAIPVEARIITACDAYSAMTTDRPYRAAQAPAAALSELERCAGSQFDPAVVLALEQLLGPTVSARSSASPVQAAPAGSGLPGVPGARRWPRRLRSAGRRGLRVRT